MRIFTKVFWQTPITIKFRLDLISKCFGFLKNHSCYTYLHFILIQKNYEVLLDTEIPLSYMSSFKAEEFSQSLVYTNSL